MPVNLQAGRKQKSSPTLAVRVLSLPSILLNHFIRRFLAEPQTLTNHYEFLMAWGLLRLFLRVRTGTGINVSGEKAGSGQEGDLNRPTVSPTKP